MVLVVQSRGDNVHDEERNGRPSLLTDVLKEGVSVKIREDRPFRIYELWEQFAVGYRSTIHKIVKNWL